MFTFTWKCPASIALERYEKSGTSEHENLHTFLKKLGAGFTATRAFGGRKSVLLLMGYK